VLALLAALLFVGGLAAGAANNVLGISLPICAVLIIVADLLTGSLARIETKLDDQVDATYDQIQRATNRSAAEKDV